MDIEERRKRVSGAVDRAAGSEILPSGRTFAENPGRLATAHERRLLSALRSAVYSARTAERRRLARIEARYAATKPMPDPKKPRGGAMTDKWWDAIHDAVSKRSPMLYSCRELKELGLADSGVAFYCDRSLGTVSGSLVLKSGQCRGCLARAKK